MAFEKNEDFKKVDNNVYSISEKSLKSILLTESQYSIAKEELEDLLVYITFYPNNLKNQDGEIETNAALFDYANSQNRLELKPLTKYKQTYYFSPTICFNLLETWGNSIGNFILPYADGLPTLKNIIDAWKREYEKIIVDDVIDLFEQKKGLTLNINLWKDMEFYKLDRKDKSIPRNLGDYDVVAVDTENRTIWNIECKFIKIVRSVKEYSNQQDGFFHQNKYDEKFQRRIDFLNINYTKLLKSKNIRHNSDFEIKSLMVVNKIFASVDKKIAFDIITIKELEVFLQKLS